MMHPEYVTCPHCGHRFAPDMPPVSELSPLAVAILTARTDTARQWQQGRPVSLRDWSKIAYAGKRQVHAAMRELVRVGYASTIPYGHKGRVQYVGVPSMLQRLHTLAA